MIVLGPCPSCDCNQCTDIEVTAFSHVFDVPARPKNGAQVLLEFTSPLLLEGDWLFSLVTEFPAGCPSGSSTCVYPEAEMYWQGSDGWFLQDLAAQRPLGAGENMKWLATSTETRTLLVLVSCGAILFDFIAIQDPNNATTALRVTLDAQWTAPPP